MTIILVFSLDIALGSVSDQFELLTCLGHQEGHHLGPEERGREGGREGGRKGGRKGGRREGGGEGGREREWKGNNYYSPY